MTQNGYYTIWYMNGASYLYFVWYEGGQRKIKRYHKVSDRRMSAPEIKAYLESIGIQKDPIKIEKARQRSEIKLMDNGYYKVGPSKYRKQESNDYIKEARLKDGGLNVEITEINKENDSWVIEDKEDRELIAVDKFIED